MVSQQDPLKGATHTGTTPTTGPARSHLDEAEPQEIHQQIDQTRSAMDQTLCELGARLEPRRLMHTAVDAIMGGRSRYPQKGATASSRTDTLSASAETCDEDVMMQIGRNALDTARRHPAAVGLIGAGLAWMLVEEFLPSRRVPTGPYSGGPEHASHGLLHRHSREYRAVGSMRSDGTSVETIDDTWGHSARSVGSRISGKVGSAVSGAVSSAGHAVARAGGKIAHKAGDAVSGAGRAVTRAGSSAAEAAGEAASSAGRATCDATGRAGEKISGAISGAASSVRHGASQLGHWASETGESIGHGAGHLASSASHRLSSMADRTSHLASDLSSRTQEAARRMGERASHYAACTSRATARSYDRYPLGMGLAVAGLGVLAGVALPRTRRENQLLGEQSERLKRRASELGAEAYDRGREVLGATAEAVREEADEHGLSPDALMRKAENVIRDAGRATNESLEREGLSPHELKGKVKEAARHVAERTSEEVKDAAGDIRSEAMGDSEPRRTPGQRGTQGGSGGHTDPSSAVSRPNAPSPLHPEGGPDI